MAKIIRKKNIDDMMFDIHYTAQKLRNYSTNTHCSECGEIAFGHYHFCPYCGAEFEEAPDTGSIVEDEQASPEEQQEFFFDCMEKIAHELGFKFEFKKPEEVL